MLPLLTHHLSPTRIGVLSIDQTVIALGWIVTGSWLVSAMLREYAAYAKRGETPRFEATLRRSLMLVMGSTIGFAGVVVGVGQISSAIGSYVAVIVGACFGFVLQNMAVTLFSASLRPRAFGIVEVTARVGGIVLGAALVLAGHGVGGYLLGLAAASLVVGAFGLAGAWPRRAGDPYSGPTDTRRWLAYGIPASSASVASWALMFIDRYLLAGMRNSGAVGIYTVGNIVGDRLVSIPLAAFAAGSVPLLFSAFETSGLAEVERLMRAYSRVIILLGFGCVAVVGGVSQALVRLVGGSAYASAADVVPLVALGAVLYGLAGLATTGLMTAKHTRPLLYSSGIGLVANIAANIALIPPLGIVGAAISTPIGTGAFLIAVTMWSRRHVTWRFPFQTLTRALVAAGLAYGASLAVAAHLHGLLIELVLTSSTALVVYTGVIVLLQEVHRRPHLGSTSRT